MTGSLEGAQAAPYLAQPGPALQPRLVSLPARATRLDLVLPAGRSLLDAIAAALAAQGHAHAVLDLAGGAFGPFAYVLPALAPDARHAAWYSDRHVPPGGAALERAAITFGTRDGAPWLHCHAIWREAAGRRAGHVLPEETVIAAPITAQAWALSGAGFQFAPDAETNFTLFQPIALSGPTAQGSRAVVLRVRPNEDPVAAIALACREHGIDRAALRGGVGSLVSPRFADAPPVPDIATELLVTGGGVTPEDGATLSVALADMQGRVHAGRVRPGANAACITCELVLEEVAE